MSRIAIGLLVLLTLVLSGILVFIGVKNRTNYDKQCNESTVASDSRRGVYHQQNELELTSNHDVTLVNLTGHVPHTSTELKNKGVDDVLVISLDKSKRWIAQVQPQMHVAGFGAHEYGAWRGVNGWTLSREQLKTVVSPQTFYKLQCGEQLQQQSSVKRQQDEGMFTRGAVGCALSHIGIWQYVASDPTVKSVLVLEDDVEFDKRASDVPRSIAKLVEYAGGVEMFDMIRLDGNESPRNHKMCAKMQKSHTPFLHRCMGMYYSFGSYIVTKRGARALLKHCFPIETHIDNLPSFVTELNRTSEEDSRFICYAVPYRDRFVRQNRSLLSSIRHKV